MPFAERTCGCHWNLGLKLVCFGPVLSTRPLPNGSLPGLLIFEDATRVSRFRSWAPLFLGP